MMSLNVIYGNVKLTKIFKMLSNPPKRQTAGNTVYVMWAVFLCAEKRYL